MSELSAEKVQEYYDLAIDAQSKAYCPYSNHPVGVVIVDSNGGVHQGCNIESAHYKGICAEGTAIGRMILSGEHRISYVLVVGPSEDYLCTPCGDCRQRIREFSDDDTLIYAMQKNGDIGKVYTMDELLPISFGPDHINIIQNK